MSAPIRVLQVISSLGMGGAETWLMEVLRLWSKDGSAQMDFLATSGNPGVFDDEARSLGAHIHYVPYGRGHLSRFASEFRSLLRTGKYDAIHDHQDYTSGWHYLLGGGLLPPVRVTHVHNPYSLFLNNYVVSLRRRVVARVGRDVTARYSTHITGTSRRVLEEYGFTASRFGSIPKAALYCGFDPARFIGNAAEKMSVYDEFAWPKDARMILFAGRIDQSPNMGHQQNHKNSAFAVEVGIECARRDQGIHLLFAGDLSPAVPILQQRVSAAGFAGRIHFAGIRKDIARLMLASDALLFPSSCEGLGMVAVEAQAAGLPVLASTSVPRECMVVPDLVRFKEVEAGPSQWATELFELMARPRDVSVANQLVAASDFAIQNSARALLALYSTGALARSG